MEVETMDELRRIMENYDTDVDGLEERFLGDRELILTCFKQFKEEKGFASLKEAVEDQNYQSAFEYAHGLKGVSGNLSLQTLYHAICDLVEHLRRHQYEFVEEELKLVLQEYEKFLKMIEEIDKLILDLSCKNE